MIEKPEANEIHVWTVDLDGVWSQIDAAQVLSEEEILRAQRFVRDQDRIRYLRAHIALRTVLCEYLEAKPQELNFEKNEFGKPSLGNNSRLEFNLSHSFGVALIGVCFEGRIGIDVEQVRADIEVSSIAERFFSSNERSKLGASAEPRHEAFFRCWTRKEAYLKAVGCGISDDDLQGVEVSLLTNERPAILRRIERGDGARGWAVADLQPRNGYIGAVVAEREKMRVISRDWHEHGVSLH